MAKKTVAGQKTLDNTEISAAVAAKTAKAPAKAAKVATPNDKLASMTAALGKVLQEDPDMIVNVDPATTKKTLPHLSTGSIILDYLIGGKPNEFGVPPCPGLPKGRLINVYGHESSGKTTVALTAAAEVCRQGGVVVYVDWEHEIDLAYAKALGVPVDDRKKFMLVQPNTLEAGLKVLWTAASAGVDLLVIDSIGAGVPEDIYNQAIEEQGHLGRVGLMAAKWSGFLPKFKVQCSKSGSTVIGIAQTRKKIETKGHGGSDTEVQGGQAWRFYSAVRILLRRVQSERVNQHNALTHKKEEQVIGGIIKAKLEKCKVSASAHHEAEYYIRHGHGIDDVRSIIDIAAAHGVIHKGGAWYEFIKMDGVSIKVQGTDQLRTRLLADPLAWTELKGRTLNKLSGLDGSVMIGAGVEEDEEAEGLPSDGLSEDLSWIGGAAPAIPDDPEADGSM